MKDKAIFVDRDEKKGITDNPLVSVITPVLNGSKYLEACIQSVLNQNYPYIEHIFVDGGSADGTLDMLSSYKAKYPDRIRFISGPDEGPGMATNKGQRMAKGEIFGWLGSDDTYEPDAVITAVEFFRSNPDAYFVFGHCNYTNEKGEVVGHSKVLDKIKDFNLKEAINDYCFIPRTSVFHRREVIEKVGLYATREERSVELDFNIRVGKVFQIHRIEETLSNFRQVGFSSSKEAHQAWIREGFIISRRHGGGLFSGWARRYYRLIIIESLRPILGPVYPFIGKVLRILRRG